MSAPLPLVVVVGGRDRRRDRDVTAVLDALVDRRGAVRLHHGGGEGCDRSVAAWARRRAMIATAEPEVRRWRWWAAHAGEVTGLVAFPGGKGTRDVARWARELDVSVWEPLAALGPS
ncbi:MAG: SLOG family protein [Pseudomonadota bacterium]